MINGDHPDAKVVDDLDETGLIRMVSKLASGIDMAGFDLKGTPNLAAGCTISPVADETQLETEKEKAAQKIGGRGRVHYSSPGV